MTCSAIETVREPQQSLLVQAARLVLSRITGLYQREADLEVSQLPDYLKRDIGFLDGRGPRYEEERLR